MPCVHSNTKNCRIFPLKSSVGELVFKLMLKHFEIPFQDTFFLIKARKQCGGSGPFWLDLDQFFGSGSIDSGNNVGFGGLISLG